MKTAILLHGICEEEQFFDRNFPSLCNAHYQPWLEKELQIYGILAQAIALPVPYNPVYKDWKNVMDGFSWKNLSIIVAHSAGAGFILKYINERKIQLNKLILVAPWVDPNKKFNDFLQCSYNHHSIDNIDEVHLFYSTDDGLEIIESVGIIKQNFQNLKIHKFFDKGHFVYDSIGATFPQLLNVCIDFR